MISSVGLLSLLSVINEGYIIFMYSLELISSKSISERDLKYNSRILISLIEKQFSKVSFFVLSPCKY